MPDRSAAGRRSGSSRILLFAPATSNLFLIRTSFRLKFLNGQAVPRYVDNFCVGNGQVGKAHLFTASAGERQVDGTLDLRGPAVAEPLENALRRLRVNILGAVAGAE